MTGFVNLWGRLQQANPPSAAEAARQVNDELMFHLRSQVEENTRRGMLDDEAWANAQMRFGSMQQYAHEIWRIDMGRQLTMQRIAMIDLLILAVLCGWLWLQVENLHGQNAQIMQLVQNSKPEENPQQDMTPYPIKLPADEMRSIPKLSVDFGKLELIGDDITALPVKCERGITGLVLLGNGSFHYAPEADKKFEGHFHAALLRFNPKDLDKILKLDSGKKVTDKGNYEMARGLLPGAVNHSWQSNGKALIPPEAAFSAVLYSAEYGDLLISAGPDEAVVYDFSDRKSLYEKK
jgi:hypothetical protein